MAKGAIMTLSYVPQPTSWTTGAFGVKREWTIIEKQSGTESERLRDVRVKQKGRNLSKST
jgi:hypothetical protein